MKIFLFFHKYLMGKIRFIKTTSEKLLETGEVQETLGEDYGDAIIHTHDENGDDTLYIGDDQVTDKLNMGEDINNLDGETVKVGNFKPLNYGQLKDMTVSEILREMFRPIGVSSISLNKSNVTLRVNGTVSLTATVTPSNATNGTVIWSSNPPGIVTLTPSGTNKVNCNVKVNNFYEEPVKITATAGGISATCTITVEPTPPTVSTSNSVSIGYNGQTLIGTDENLPEESDISVNIIDGSWSDGTPYAGGHDDIVLTMNPDMWGQSVEEGTYTISGSVNFYEGETPKDNAGNDHTTHYAGGIVNASSSITLNVREPIYINGYLTSGNDDGDDITVMRRYLVDYMNTETLYVTVPMEIEIPEPVKFKIQVPEQFTSMTVLQENTIKSTEDEIIYDINVPLVFVNGDNPYYERENNDETKTIATKYKITFRK